MTKERKIELWTTIVAAGFAAGVIYHYYRGVALGRSYPYNTFLFQPWDYFRDYYEVVHRSLSAYGPSASNDGLIPLPYPPAMCAFASLFLRMGEPLGIVVFLSGFIAAFVWFCWPIMKAPTHAATVRNIVIFTAMSYPVLFAVDRGNFEMYAFVAMAAFIYFFARDRHGIAAAFLGLAVSFKLVPVVFLVLFIAHRRFLWGAFSIGWAALFTLAALLWLPGSIGANLAGWRHNVAAFTSGFGNDWISWAFSLSLFHSIRSYVAFLNPYDVNRNVVAIAGFYSYASVLVGVLVAGFVAFFSKTLWKQVLLLTMCCNHLPKVSSSYKLLYVFLPIVLLAEARKKSRYEFAIVFLLGLMLIPKSYVILFPSHILQMRSPASDAFVLGQDEVTEAVLINPLIGVIVSILVTLSEIQRPSTLIEDALKDEDAAENEHSCRRRGSPGR